MIDAVLLERLDRIDPIEPDTPARFTMLVEAPAGRLPDPPARRRPADRHDRDLRLGGRPARRAACASWPGSKRPVPSHQGHGDLVRRAALVRDHAAGAAAGAAAAGVVGRLRRRGSPRGTVAARSEAGRGDRRLRARRVGVRAADRGVRRAVRRQVPALDGRDLAVGEDVLEPQRAEAAAPRPGCRRRGTARRAPRASPAASGRRGRSTNSGSNAAVITASSSGLVNRARRWAPRRPRPGSVRAVPPALVQSQPSMPSCARDHRDGADAAQDGEAADLAGGLAPGPGRPRRPSRARAGARAAPAARGRARSSCRPR